MVSLEAKNSGDRIFGEANPSASWPFWRLIGESKLQTLLENRMDVAVRAGPLKSSSLVARKLGATAMTIVAAPSYARKRGLPQTIEELEMHDRLGLDYTRAIDGWPLKSESGTILVPVTARVHANDNETLRQLAHGGSGNCSPFQLHDPRRLEGGRLVSILDAHNPGDREEFHAIHIGQGGPLPSRVRSLFHFLARQGRVK